MYDTKERDADIWIEKRLNIGRQHIFTRKGEDIMRFKKIISGLLVGALAVTSVFTGNVTTAKAEVAAEAPIYETPSCGDSS